MIEQGERLKAIADRWQASAATTMQHAVRKWIARRRREKLLAQTREVGTFVGGMKPPADDESEYDDEFEDEDVDDYVDNYAAARD